ncbi:asparagine synthase-related protein [Actinomyces sp. HMSC065F11]|uniref:asparagine synthase-related protein n=1 Tax=Actinomyces sp. HMSC065F11 TaxID=1739395 RepID=UPI0008A2D0A2|nr:asparagine synthase-related protein [Actinomyces sp. HMSC065F11]OFR31180.1 hypothetical protein HMPREF2891_03815 [Actinomyces sp. HMSC065F11]
MIIADEEKWTKHQLSIGHVWWRNSLGIPPVDTATTSVTDWARLQPGNWGAIIQQGNQVFACTDGPRSYPLLYTRVDGELVLSSTPNELLAKLAAPTRNHSAAEEFRHLGYVTGTDTLVDGVSTVPAGSAVTFDADATTSTSSHTGAFKHELLDVPTEAHLQSFYETLLELTNNMVVNSNGHQILIPLSGGADSRLILTLLREVDAKNVLTFTYGVGKSEEGGISQSVANGLGFDWKYIQLDPTAVHDRWYRHDTTKFLQDTWSANALPHIQDWFALQELSEDQDVDERAVISPGHTVVGNEHDSWSFAPEVPIRHHEMARIISHHHFILQGNPNFALRNRYALEKLEQFLDTYWADSNPNMRAHVLAQYNILERQAKYINNSVRAYEHFGFQWAMPMLETPAYDSWFSVPARTWGIDRAPYIKFTNDKYQEIAGIELPNYLSPAEKLNPTFKNRIKKVSDMLGVTHAINRSFGIKASLNHPMAFQALAGNLSKSQLARQLISGKELLGVYANLFLDGDWVPEGDIVP